MARLVSVAIVPDGALSPLDHPSWIGPDKHAYRKLARFQSTAAYRAYHSARRNDGKGLIGRNPFLSRALTRAVEERRGSHAGGVYSDSSGLPRPVPTWSGASRGSGRDRVGACGAFDFPQITTLRLLNAFLTSHSNGTNKVIDSYYTFCYSFLCIAQQILACLPGV